MRRWLRDLFRDDEDSTVTEEESATRVVFWCGVMYVAGPIIVAVVEALRG